MSGIRVIKILFDPPAGRIFPPTMFFPPLLKERPPLLHFLNVLIYISPIFFLALIRIYRRGRNFLFIIPLLFSLQPLLF